MATSSDDETQQTEAASEPGASERRASRPSIPPRLGRYVVVRLLGRGGVGAVYEAEDPEVGRRVAIKVLREDRDGDAEELRAEAQALGRLVHPNVVTIHDVGVAGDEVFLVMQLVDGEPLDRWAAARTPSTAEILALFHQAGEGLAAAHAAGLVHCDFKPGNVLVDRQGVARVSDFGLARASRAAADTHAIASTSLVSISGTPAYMAPEQFEGVATAASDQFSFCVALWEMLAGERPFDDSSIHATDVRAARGPLRTRALEERIPAHLARVLERGLADRPADRFPSMTELLAAIDAATRSRRLRWLAVPAVAVLGAALVTVLVWPRHRGQGPAWNGADLEHPRVLTREGCDDSPVIDASGLVVFGRTIRDEVDLYAVSLAGGDARRLTSAPTWEWRPNAGRRPGEVVHLIHDGKNSAGASLAYLDLATGAETTAAAVYAWDAVTAGAWLVYSPDEPGGLRRLADRRDRGFLDPSSSHSYMLIAAAPRGDQIATTETTINGGPTHPCVVDVATRAMHCSPTSSSDGRPAFGADGRTLYFSAVDGLRRRDLETGEETVFAPGVWSDGGLAIAGDGSALVYSECRGNYAIVDLAADRVVVPGPDAIGVALGPAGMVAWVHDQRGVDVLLARGGDGHELELTDAGFGSALSPAFSPDGRHVAFAVGAPAPGIHTVRVTNPGAPHRLTDDPGDHTPIWTASGTIAFTRTEGTSDHVFAIASDGGTPRRLTPSARTGYAGRGDEIVVDTGESETTSLRWLDVTTGVERAGPGRPDGFLKGLAISPNGAWLGFLIGVNGQDIWRLRLDPPGTLEHVRALPSGDIATGIAITDDGHLLAVDVTWAGGLTVIPARPGARF